jgi:hypothetical protein
MFNRILSGNIYTQTVRAFNRKCFIQEVKLDRTFVKVESIVPTTFESSITNTKFAIVTNIKTNKQEKVCCDYLRELTEDEKRLLKMEERLPEIEGLF